MRGLIEYQGMSGEGARFWGWSMICVAWNAGAIFVYVAAAALAWRLIA